MIVIRQKPADAPKPNYAAGIVASLASALPVYGKMQHQQHQNQLAMDEHQAKVRKYDADAGLLRQQANNARLKGDALSAMPDALSVLQRNTTDGLQTGPANNLVSMPITPEQIGSAYSNLAIGTESNLAQLGDFQMDQDQLAGNNALRAQVQQSALPDISQFSVLNAINQGHDIGAPFSTNSNGMVTNEYTGAVTPETLGIVDSLMAENNAAAAADEAHARLYDAQAGQEGVQDPGKAPTGYLWNDPSDPAAGVAPIPGYVKPSGITIGANGALQVQGNRPLGKETGKDADSTIVQGLQNVRKLANIVNSADRDLFEFVPRLAGSVSEIRSRLGREMTEREQDYINRREAIITPIEQFFNEYRKYITGAAASEKELESLRRTFINGELPYETFVARSNALINSWKADIEQAQSFMNNGVPTGRVQADPVQVTTMDEAYALPPGTQFVDPNGQLRVRP